MLYGGPCVYINDLFLYLETQTPQFYTMAIGQFQEDICLWGVNQDTKDSRVTTTWPRDSSPNWSLKRWVPKRLSSSPHGRSPMLQYFLPWQQSRYQGMTPGFTTHESSHGSKQKRTFNIPVSPWEISDTYSELQMSVILMNTPKIQFLGIRFLRTALKCQHSLAGVVLQNRQKIDLLIPEQGGTWAILNEMCCSWVNTSS